MREVLAVSALALALAVAGCGGGGDGDETIRDEVIDAAQRTADQDGLRADIIGEIGVEGAPGPLPVSGTTVIAEGGGRTRGTVDISAVAAPGTEGGATDLITIGDELYLRGPGLRPQGAAEQWILFSAQVREQNDIGAGPAGLGDEDPTEVLAALGDTAGDIEEVGQEDVRGVATTRYRTTLDLSEVEGAEEDGVDGPVAAEVWVGDDGLVRRVRQRVPVSEAGQSAEIDFTLEYFDFGVEERIEPPPEDDVISIEDSLSEP